MAKIPTKFKKLGPGTKAPQLHPPSPGNKPAPKGEMELKRKKDK